METEYYNAYYGHKVWTHWKDEPSLLQGADRGGGRGVFREPWGENSSPVDKNSFTTCTVTSRTSKFLYVVRFCIAKFIATFTRYYKGGYSKRAVRKVSGHFEYLENRSSGLDVT